MLGILPILENGHKPFFRDLRGDQRCRKSLSDMIQSYAVK